MEYSAIWRASEASETLTGVTQLKIGDVCLFVLCLDVRMSFCTLTLSYFQLARCLTPSQTSLNSILWYIDHYPYLPRNCIVYHFEFFCRCSLNSKTYWSSISIRVSGDGQQYLLENSLSTRLSTR